MSRLTDERNHYWVPEHGASGPRYRIGRMLRLTQGRTP